MAFSKYPHQIDTHVEIPPVIDNSTEVKANVINRLRDAILAIETELGVKPSGTYGTLKDRINDIQLLVDTMREELGTNPSGTFDNVEVRLEDMDSRIVEASQSGGSGGETFPTLSENLTIPLVLNNNRVIIVNSGDELALAVAETGHLDGAQKVILLPDNTRTSLILAPILNAQGDITINSSGLVTNFSVGSIYIIIISYTAGKFVTLVRVLSDPDLVAPTVVSATVSDTNANALVVVPTKRVVIPSVNGLDGLSVDFVSGTPRVITGLESGNGSTNLVFTLSGNFDGTEVANFVVASNRTAQGLNGPKLAIGSTSITINFGPNGAIPGATHLWRGDQRTLSGSNVLTVIDQIGNNNLAFSSVSPTITTIGTLNGPAMTMITNAKMYVDVTSEVMTSGALAITVRQPALGTHVMIAGGNNSALTTFECITYIAGGNLLGASNQAQTGVINQADSNTLLKDILFTWDTSGREMYLNGVLFASNTTDATCPNIGRWVVGSLPDLSTLQAENDIFVDMQVSNQHLVLQDAVDYHAWRLATYGT